MGILPHGVTVNPVDVTQFTTPNVAHFGQAVSGVARQQFPALELPGRVVIIRSLAANTGSVLIGNQTVTDDIDGTGNGYILEAGDTVPIFVDNMQRLWHIATAAGCVISWTAS